MNTILTDDERPELPPTNTVPRDYFTAEQMEAYADAREAAVLAKLAQQEPIGFMSEQQVPRIQDNEDESGCYLPMRKTPAGNFTLALYTHPAPQQADRQRVPAGWKLVPVEPTWEMLEAALDCAAKPSHREAYAAMLAAAPEAPAQEPHCLDGECSDCTPRQDFSDAYQGASEDLAIWKKRALEAEELNRKFMREINGQTFMGEPASKTPAQASAVDERAAFEAELRRQCFQKPTPEAYDLAWCMWQARAALAQFGGGLFAENETLKETLQRGREVWIASAEAWSRDVAEKDALLRQAWAVIRWQCFGECRTDGVDGLPTPSEVDIAIREHLNK